MRCVAVLYFEQLRLAHAYMQRRMHAQAEQAKAAGYDGSALYSQDPGAAGNEFRARFRNPLVAPSPFGTLHPPPGAPEIDPSLGGSPSGIARGNSGSSLDGELAKVEDDET